MWGMFCEVLIHSLKYSDILHNDSDPVYPTLEVRDILPGADAFNIVQNDLPIADRFL